MIEYMSPDNQVVMANNLANIFFPPPYPILPPQSPDVSSQRAESQKDSCLFSPVPSSVEFRQPVVSIIRTISTCPL